MKTENKELHEYLSLNYSKQIENTIREAFEYKFGKFDWLRVEHSEGNLEIEFYKEGVSKKEALDFLEEIKNPNN